MSDWLGRALSWLRGRPVVYDLASYDSELAAINGLERQLTSLSDADLAGRSALVRTRALEGTALDALVPEAFALVREAARRALGQRLFDVQVLVGLAMHRGNVAELPTGEGKTLAAVAPAYLGSLRGEGVHVLTFNDYLARRDACWMGAVYRRLGISTGFVNEGMAVAARREAYRRDVTYVTAREAGFDRLRDGLALEESDQVQRTCHFAIVDEADSILIDEARTPLVIAGETAELARAAERVAPIARRMQEGVDFDTDEYRHNIALTESGAARAEQLMGRGALYGPENLRDFAALRNALHAEFLMKRDVDYIVRDGGIELVDDFTGRIAEKRRWPDGLQAAIEAKEGVRIQAEGRILASITLQHFVRLYPRLAGMSATADSAAEELHEIYGLRVVVIGAHRPVIRTDHPDVVFMDRAAKRAAVVAEIVGVHRTGRPLLVGTASVRESEELAGELGRAGVECRVLNAKHDDLEAEIVASAGSLGAVTISTNMAGRGTDIRLGGADEAQRAEVAVLGGLCVVGTSRHASTRVDRQLRGRAGRQGDPGSSRFFVSLEDPLMARYGVAELASSGRLHARSDGVVEGDLAPTEIARVQRIIEAESFAVRQTLYAYSEPVELQRLTMQARRQELILRQAPSLLAQARPERWAALSRSVEVAALREIERRLTLAVIDRCWSEYLVEVGELRDDSHLLAFAGRVPVAEFHRQVGVAFMALEERIEAELRERFDALAITAQGVDWGAAGLGPSATWTYVVGENPFGVSGYASSSIRPALGLAALVLGPLALLPGIAALLKRKRPGTPDEERAGGPSPDELP